MGSVLSLLWQYRQVAGIAAVVVLGFGYCAQRDAQLRRQGELRILRAQVDSLDRVYTEMRDTADALRDSILVQTDTVVVTVARVFRDTVTVAQQFETVREVVPDSVVAAVDSLQAAYNQATDALTLAYALIDQQDRQIGVLERANANLERQITILRDAEDRGSSWLSTPAKLLGGALTGYALAQLTR